MQVGGIGGSPLGGSALGGGGGSADGKAAQAAGDLQQQKADDALTEEISKESNREAKMHNTRMTVINNMKQ
jgi:hypothetical protein